MSKVIIIGGGAAGMFAALGAADAGHQVTILEQNDISREKADAI